MGPLWKSVLERNMSPAFRLSFCSLWAYLHLCEKRLFLLVMKENIVRAEELMGMLGETDIMGPNC